MDLTRREPFNPDPPTGQKSSLPCKEHPLLNELIVQNLMQLLDFDNLRSARLVCKLWNDISFYRFQEKVVVTFSQESEHNEFEIDLDGKKRQFKKYLKGFRKGSLPFMSSEELLFRNFKFINYVPPRRGSLLDPEYPHNDILTALRISSDASIPLFNYTATISGLYFKDPDNQQGYVSDFKYPDWGLLLGSCDNLRILSLDGMPEREIYNCMFQYYEFIAQGGQTQKIKNLIINPDQLASLQRPLSKETHDAYAELLSKVLQILPQLQDLTLISNFSADELWPILSKCNNKLKSLTLGRLTPTPNFILLHQRNIDTIFRDDFPLLSHLQIPNVYFHRIQELVEKCRNLKSLILTLQPIILSFDPYDSINYVDHVLGTNLEFLSDFWDERGQTSSKLESLEWQVDRHMEPVLRASNISVEEVTDSAFLGFAQYYPNIQVLRSFVSSGEALKIIWKNFKGLREITVAQESTHASVDADFEECAGIFRMNDLQTLRLLNDNSNLTEKSVMSFMKIASLQKLEIRRAPNLSTCSDRLMKLADTCPLLQIRISKD
ncbi:unnamed protein product [Allacma fusca]|uniref:F-box domain-containing protein n=1 Tax=Allacma fusca TaxID=39272 RepID=A0A8J2KWY6_9HEXA|nr:unnamed protein product [Allacma fusca]